MGTKIRWKDVTPELKARLIKAELLNGCGPKLRWVNYLVPDWLFGLHVHEDCQHHDFNYLIGHTEADREKGDEQFYDEIRKRALAKSQPWWKRMLRPLYLRVAKIYRWGVRRWGAKFGGFYYGPRERSLEDIEALLAEVENA